ncbi:hypothetical protein Y032_0005g2498 [Ancylostoma ceylanicum]|uniref:SEFIR domain-containing protein n=1 Tax=Ancylostoma ceylanicum TaxID=53326 RepID=A0A016VT14_9BILA|nr:hypothetical protein Y032_0005g2498 [Ancylostoma ceylanicum]
MIILLCLFLLGFVTASDDANDTSLLILNSPVPTEPRPTTTVLPKTNNDSAVIELINATTPKHLTDASVFQSDCSDPHNKEIACSVHVVNCDEKLFDPVATGREPPEAHDVRVEAFAKAMARQEGHQLHVDVSWQMPPKNNSVLLRAFKLQINGTDGDRCFVFNVTDFGWTQDSASPRFHFTSESLFEFSEGYRITLYSLPASTSRTPVVVKESRMPVDPELTYDDDRSNISQYCKTHTNTEASKWTAAFRRIFLQSITRTIQIEFVGAPPHFCFEEYEVRLLDETGIELLHHTTIKAKDMKKEIIDGKVVYFGEYNFTGLEVKSLRDLDEGCEESMLQVRGSSRSHRDPAAAALGSRTRNPSISSTWTYGVDYIPSVIPVEMSSDGRCLCPTSEQHGACSCIAADWKRVRLQRIEKPAPVINATIPTITRQSDENKYWPIYAALIALCLLFSLCFVITVLVMFYRKYSKRGKSVRIRFISDHVSNNGMVAAEPRAPLIYNSPTSVLLVYTHDCPQHEAVVIALAELLRDTFKMDVHLDAWDETEIEKNLYEYINSSIVKADKIVVINSIGAYYRVRARYLGSETIERVHKSPLDGLFMSQLDLVLQHARLISARFSYTPSNCTLFALTPLLQYTIPDNLGLFVASLSDSQLRNDPRLAGFNPQQARLQAAIAAMVQLMENEPKWFEKSHYRVRLPPSVARPPPRSLDSGIGDSETAASSVVVPITQPLTLHCPQPDDVASTSSPTGVVVATSPLEEDARPLLEEEAEEVEPVEEKQPHDDVSADSAFHSAVVVDEIPPEREVRDKPRLPSRHEPLHLDGDEAIVEPALLKHRPDMDQNDSGMVSNLTSAQLSV